MVRLMAVVAAFITLAGCVMGQGDSRPLDVVRHVDLERYAGVWYELARYPNSFQKGCYGSMATYTLREGGGLTVLNQCYDGGPDGKLRKAAGKAWVTDPVTNAKLKVSFFWPFAGEYWVIELGKDYEYAVVGHPGRKYLWILSRTPDMDDGVYRGILERLEKLHGYDTSKLIMSRHL